MVADKAAKLAFGPRSRSKFDPAVAGVALGTSDIGLSHRWKCTTPGFLPLVKNAVNSSAASHYSTKPIYRF
jgi:hypothetical protein